MRNFTRLMGLGFLMLAASSCNKYDDVTPSGPASVTKFTVDLLATMELGSVQTQFCSGSNSAKVKIDGTVTQNLSDGTKYTDRFSSSPFSSYPHHYDCSNYLLDVVITDLYNRNGPSVLESVQPDCTIKLIPDIYRGQLLKLVGRGQFKPGSIPGLVGNQGVIYGTNTRFPAAMTINCPL